jgi:glycogen(starch) synthase
MKILMLGWEYPPHIAGGLGTACRGLTGALSQRGIAIHFVVPHLFGDEVAPQIVLTEPFVSEVAVDGVVARRADSGPGGHHDRSEDDRHTARADTVATSRIPAFLAPYWSASRFKEAVSQFSQDRQERAEALQRALIDGEVFGVDVVSAPASSEFDVPRDAAEEESLYPEDESIFGEVERFTTQLMSSCSAYDFDIIHAHDWMTFPAGVALSQLTGKPLVVHVHSLEQDRRGLFVDRNIEKIERLGLETASLIIAVSHYTRRAIERFHGIASDRIRVVHNGVYRREALQDYRVKKTWPRRVVLFVGRVTFQKGPDYFVEVATRVIPRIPEVLFVLGGTGDMLPTVQRRVQELGLSEHFMFPGFLSGEELEEMFAVADVYVMPSVSEPFGITALEAINFETPVIISKQSGVSEVIEHALKVDFWDLERMADMIVNVLLNPQLREDLVSMAKDEVKDLHWDAAAAKTIDVYRELMGASRPQEAIEAFRARLGSR